jgi:hypothetical protein
LVTAETKPAKPPDCGGCVLTAGGFVYGGIGSAGRAVRSSRSFVAELI